MEIKMKRILAISAIAIMAILVASSIAESQSSTDYKIIKNAIKKNGSTWKEAKNLVLHMDIQNRNDDTTVKIEMPFNIVEYLVESCKDTDIHVDGGREVFKLRETIDKLKSAGPSTLVEINFEESHSTIKIWLE
jgi:hypothetical protein